MSPLGNLSFDETTRRHIANNIEAFEVRPQPLDALRPAAVALVVVESQGQLALLLTRRAGTLRAHSGQWALPGGRIDPGENAETAALREVQEEINLDLPKDAVVGVLDDYITRSGYRITPVVAWADTDIAMLSPNPSEVASVHTISFDDLARPDAPQFDRIPESGREIISMQLEVDQVFAPTAAMLFQFREVVIFGRPTRVFHYDQPRFAWR
ncbi:MAG: CoA pyrophosphatase [Luminiphilus sp.]|nr:CoA pyrophosphatase [Luminiphilus sp.]MDG1506806.1 CoA pyrophosphatase [Luminiphilus sp.]